MPKLTNNVVQRLQSNGSKQGTLFWDDQLKGFGVRVFPSGAKTFVLKFRTRSGRQRWLKIGAASSLTAEQARERASAELLRVIDGEDPADQRAQLRTALTVEELCRFYLDAAEAGLMLGRKGQPKATRTIANDQTRVAVHINPVLGKRKASEVTRAHVEQLKKDIVDGRTARDEKLGPRRRSIVRGGKGAASKSISILSAIYAWGQEMGYVDHNPARGVKRFADRQRKALLTADQYRWLSCSLDALDAKRDRNGARMHSAVGLAMIRCLALTGLRRGECEQLTWSEVDAHGQCLALSATKTGPSLRPLSRIAFEIIDGQAPISDYVFPSGPEAGPYSGLSGLWRTVQNEARRFARAADVAEGASTLEGPLSGLTLHSLRHSFAGVAEQLGATIPTIAALLGHRIGGVTSGYILKRVDTLLVETANRVADQIAAMMRGEAVSVDVAAFRPMGRTRVAPIPPAQPSS